MIRISKTGHIVTINSKPIKTPPLTTEQYLRDQINKITADPVNEILKNYEQLAQENVSNNHDSRGKEHQYMNNHNDIQHNNMQEHVANRITASHE